MNQLPRKTSISLQDAEQQLGTFVIEALQNNFEELRLWARSAPITMYNGSPIIKIDTDRHAAQKFMNGIISLGKFGELLGLRPGEIHDFKMAILRAVDEYTS